VDAALLTALSGLHLYWAAGGRAGAEVVVPREPGFTLRPTRGATLAVAVALAVAALIMIGQAGWVQGVGSGGRAEWLRPALRLAALGMALVFAARAIGDFRYLGFFKRRRNSRFARWDTRLYSPLCTLLAVLALLAALPG
jgi:hypothetical protein